MSIDAISFWANLLLFLQTKYSYIVFNIDVRVRRGAIKVTSPTWYALTEDISIKHQVKAKSKKLLLS